MNKIDKILQDLESIKMSSIISSKNVLNIEEASFLTGFSVDTLRRKVGARELSAFRPNGKHLFFMKCDLETWMTRGKILTVEEVNRNMPREKIKLKGVKTYIMIDLRTKFYKIGKSVNPKYREGTLRSEDPNVRLLYICKEDVESELHRCYSDKRVRGEWFSLNSFDIETITEVYGFEPVKDIRL